MIKKSQKKLLLEQLPDKFTQTAFAKTVGCNQSAVSRGVKSGRITMGSDGYLDKSQITAWFVNRDEAKIRENSVGRKPGVPTQGQMEDLRELSEIKLAKSRLELELQQRELQKSKGELVPRDEVKRGISDFSRLLSQKLTNFPSRYGLEIAAAAGCEARPLISALEKFMRAQIEELSSVKPTLPG